MSTNGDYGEDFIYRMRQQRYQKTYSRTSTSRTRSALGYSLEPHHHHTYQPPQPQLPQFTETEIAFFLTVNLRPDEVRRIIRDDPPPSAFYKLEPVVKAGYLFYHEIYGHHFNYDMETFTKRFFLEYFKYTCKNLTAEQALYRICEHTKREYERDQQKLAAALAAGRATPESRESWPSYEESDSFVLEPPNREPLKNRTHHAGVKFAPGGRLILLNPRHALSSVEIRSVKSLITDPSVRRITDIMDRFKGPLIYNETKPQTLLLFIEREIENIYSSDVYRGNPDSNDTNDCLLIWKLLQMLIMQQGRVTGPDLARLLVKSQEEVNASVGNVSGRQPSIDAESDLAECTYYLVRGCVDDAIDSAVRQGCLFDALVLAESLYAYQPEKLATIKAHLMATRSAQHPLSTLNSVAANRPVPLLTSANSDDGRGWRMHIAILLANLQTPAAYESIYQLGLDLARKEFDSAADFCFLAVNLLSGRNCFVSPSLPGMATSSYRQHVSRVKATLPDDEIHAAKTSYGWSLLDFCATEIYEYALRQASGGAPTALSMSPDYQRCRYEYAQLLNELGGYNVNVQAYRPSAYACDNYSNTVSSPIQCSTPLQHSSPQRSSAPSPQQSSMSPTPYEQPSSTYSHAAAAAAFVVPAPLQRPIAPTPTPMTAAPHAPAVAVAPPAASSASMTATTPSSVIAATATSPAQQANAQQPSPPPSAPPSPLQPPPFIAFSGTAAAAPPPMPPSIPMPQQPPMRQQQPPQRQSPAPLSIPTADSIAASSAAFAAAMPPPTSISTSNNQRPKQPERPASAAAARAPATSSNGGGKSSGWLGSMISKSSAMILPDDSKIPEEQRIRWDDTLKRYVGAVEEEVAPPPPPSNRVADVPPAAAVIATAVAAPPHLAAAYATPAVAEDAAATAPAVSPVAYPYVAMNSMPTLPTPTAVPSSSMRRGPSRYVNSFQQADSSQQQQAAPPPY